MSDSNSDKDIDNENDDAPIMTLDEVNAFIKTIEPPSEKEQANEQKDKMDNSSSSRIGPLIDKISHSVKLCNKV